MSLEFENLPSSEEILSEFSHAVPESERIISEPIYDCWKYVPLDVGEVTIKDGTKEEFNISLRDLNFPENYKIRYDFSLPSIIRYLKDYEEINLPSDIIRPSLMSFADNASHELLYAIRRVKEEELNGAAEVPDVLLSEEVDDDEFHKNMSMLLLLRAYGEDLPISTVLQKATDDIKGVISELNQSTPLCNGLRNVIEKEQLLERRTDSRSLTPTPAIWHGDWLDSRFPNGGISADLVIGGIPTNNFRGDIDASAVENLRREAKSLLVIVRGGTSEDQDIFVPPNMTNMYMIGIPITCNVEEVSKIYTKDDGFLRVVFCDTPDRVNPVQFGAVLDKEYGTDSWIMVSSSPIDGKLMRVIQKPKEEWKISSRTRRNMSLSTAVDNIVA